MQHDLVSQGLLLAGVGFVAGAMNAVAGGGSFVSLPALIAAGVPSLNANASSTLALLPGAFTSAFAYREDLRPFSALSLRAMFATSVVGGLIGALLLMFTPQRAFDHLLPWLLLVGAITFALGRKAGRWLHARVAIGPVVGLTTQFLLGVYGGFFGGAVGIMMMAAWSLLGATDLHAMNASRTLIVGATNAIAALVFVLGGLIFWPQTLVMLVTAAVGSYIAARITRRLDAEIARRVVIALQFLITALFFWRTYGA